MIVILVTKVEYNKLEQYFIYKEEDIGKAQEKFIELMEEYSYDDSQGYIQDAINRKCYSADYVQIRLVYSRIQE